MDIIIKILQLILCLSILVIIHELGHFTFARLFKTRVEKFYLFFNPWFELFKFKKGDTEYGIGWLPLGGYVKIAGMIDESMDKEAMKQPAKSDEFRSKKAWQRLLIMIGGVMFNFILAFFIYSMILFTWGAKYLPNDSLVDGILVVDPLAQELGLKTGDKILSYDGEVQKNFSDVAENLLYAKSIQIERKGENINIALPVDVVGQLIKRKSRRLISYRFPFVISGFKSKEFAEETPLKLKDQVVAINGYEIRYFDQVKSVLSKYKNDSVELLVKRGKKLLSINALIDDKSRIGVNVAHFGLNDLDRFGVYKVDTHKYGFFASFPAGFNMAIAKLGSYYKQFKLIVNPETKAYKGVGGFGTMAKIFPTEWNAEHFWSITAFMSIMLGFVNILPIPALDGGHVLFLLYEIIARRAPSEKFLEYAQVVGFVILLSLVVLANGNDILRAFK